MTIDRSLQLTISVHCDLIALTIRSSDSTALAVKLVRALCYGLAVLGESSIAVDVECNVLAIAYAPLTEDRDCVGSYSVEFINSSIGNFSVIILIYGIDVYEPLLVAKVSYRNERLAVDALVIVDVLHTRFSIVRNLTTIHHVRTFAHGIEDREFSQGITLFIYIKVEKV